MHIVHINVHKIHYTNRTRLERNDSPVVQPADQPMSRNVHPGSLFICTFCNNAIEMQLYHSLGLFLIHDDTAGLQHAAPTLNSHYERSLFYQTHFVFSCRFAYSSCEAHSLGRPYTRRKAKRYFQHKMKTLYISNSFMYSTGCCVYTLHISAHHSHALCPSKGIEKLLHT